MPEDKKMGDSPQKCEEAGSEEIVVVEPTYRQEPEDNEKFYCSHAAGIAQETLRENLEGLSDKMLDSWTDFGDEAEELSKKIADLIKLRVKEMNIPRFKVVVQVNIGQKKDQGVLLTSRCLWSNLDNYATASYQDEKIWATAITFAIYTE